MSYRILYLIIAALFLIIAALFLTVAAKADPVDGFLNETYTKYGEDLTPGMGTYSRGFRLGRLNKCSLKGFMRKSTECNFMVGNKGIYLEKLVTCGDSKCTKIINPWKFSSGEESFDKLNDDSGKYWVIEYAQSVSNVSAVSGRDTEYEYVRSFRPIKKEVKACNRTDISKGSWSNGARTGRLVKLSVKGLMAKSFEATVQEGDEGSQFIAMSITTTDVDFLRCAYETLFSAKSVKVIYAEDMLFNPATSDTAYEIIGLEPVEEGL